MTWLTRGSDSTAEGTAAIRPVLSFEREVGRGAEVFTHARERAVAVRLVGDSRVLVPERVVMRTGGAVVATSIRVEGIDVDALLARRGFFSVGECVYLGQELCGALAALHDKGLAHGDVSPANVMISRAGVVLVDTIGGALPNEAGTEGYRAPERAGGASAESDVYSVGAVLAACIDPSMKDEFMGWLDPLLDPVPHRRPRARGVEAGLGQCADAIPILIPDDGLVGELRAQAHEPRARTSVLPGTWGWRVKRMGLRVGATVLGIVVVVSGVVYVLPRSDGAFAVGVNLTSESIPSAGPLAPLTEVIDASAPSLATEPESAVTAARTLTNARFSALAEGDADALLATGSPGSPVAEQLEAQASELKAGDLRFEGLEATVIAADVPVADSEADDGSLARVVVTYVVSGHSVWRRDPTTGSSQRTEIESHSEAVELELLLNGTTWQVARALLPS